MNDLGKRIRECRVDKKLTQKKLAEKIYVNQWTVSHWECGRRIPSVVDLIELSKVLCVSIDYLLGQTERKEKL